ncbi:peptidoglycan-binding protein [Geotalea uraniireducens]|uniref:Peptidoglycan-binding domain 1 protein n=1 Tax=Geotalea uraniireducens (strain Rf4) TaxID=351605 RepID=A5G761_GEOUR|nr:peptidoglycan-binding protein [Geotalea uraniireducens]ABQ27629.1 Peptidoglycan-binding domain 1 protein [Geotalea uraniireducens Rf4]
MAKKQTIVLSGVLVFAAVATVGGWVASTRIQSPAEMAARAAPPVASPILVPVEKRVLSSNVVTRGTARFGLPQPISIVPSALKKDAGLIATLPLPNTQFREGDVMLTASGRPLFILQGKLPAYRDLVPGISGDDVRQLQQGLKRLGYHPGPIDGIYTHQTSIAVAKWYKSKGREPFGSTPDQLASVSTLELAWTDAKKSELTAVAAAAAAVPAVETARASAERNNKAAAAELAAKMADQRRFTVNPITGTPLGVETARATADEKNKAAAAELEARIAERALIALDPRQPATARKAADAKLEVARAVLRSSQLEGKMAVQAAERDDKLAAEQFKLAEAAVKSVRLEGEMAVRSAVDALKIAEFDAKIARDRTNRLAADLAKAERKLGVQVPVDEIVFIPELPVRVKEVTARVGDPAKGTVLSVTDNKLAIDASLPFDAAPLVKPGMPVAIDEQALGVKAKGVVERVADTPGTFGADGYHIYFEVRVIETSTPQMEGISVRLTIPVKSTGGAVTVVPISALSLASDGKSRVQVKNKGTLEYLVVQPGLSADGYVEVTPVDRTLEPGRLVVVGYENPEKRTPP